MRLARTAPPAAAGPNPPTATLTLTLTELTSGPAARSPRRSSVRCVRVCFCLRYLKLNKLCESSSLS